MNFVDGLGFSRLDKRNVRKEFILVEINKSSVAVDFESMWSLLQVERQSRIHNLLCFVIITECKLFERISADRFYFLTVNFCFWRPAPNIIEVFVLNPIVAALWNVCTKLDIQFTLLFA